MNCELNLVPLSCDRTGVGFTAIPLSADSNKLRLMKGHAKHFPALEGQQYFYIKIGGCNGCCETAKVVEIEEDTLILDRTISSKCACIQSNARVDYLWDSIHVVRDISASIGINVLSPLKYDHCTRTLSVDCKELFAADCGGCGCGEGAVTTGSGTSTTVAGLRGKQGEKGEQGVGVASLSISAAGQLLYTLTDGTARSAGTLPQSKGARGETGAKGDKGDQGEKGEDAPKVAQITATGTTATIIYTDNSSTEIDVSALKGETGAKGDQGDQGEKGDAGYSFQYVEIGSNAYIFGYPNTSVTLSSPSLSGMTFGPYTTGADGLVEIVKPNINGQVLMQIKQGNTLVGIGRAG